MARYWLAAAERPPPLVETLEICTMFYNLPFIKGTGGYIPGLSNHPIFI